MKTFLFIAAPLVLLALLIFWAGVSMSRGSTRGTWRCIFDSLFHKKENDMRIGDVKNKQYFICKQNDTLFYKGLDGTIEYWNTNKATWFFLSGASDPQPTGEVYIPDKAEITRRIDI